MSNEARTYWPTSDLLLACLFPLTILLVSVRVFPHTTFQDFKNLIMPRSAGTPTRAGPFSLERAVKAYDVYNVTAGRELNRMRGAYNDLGRAHKRVGYEIGYPAKLDRLAEATRENSLVTKGIAKLGKEEFPELAKGASDVAISGGPELHRVREAMKHFVRDWSEDGQVERDVIFEPILEVLREVPVEKRAGMRVLVPGSGLGRLAWEISQLGFDTTANELSFFMNLSLRFLLSPKTTTEPNQHSVQPYSHWFSHQRTTDAVFRSIPFPDVVPRLEPGRFSIEERDFFTITPGPQSSEGTKTSTTAFWNRNKGTLTYKSNDGFDFVVSLFFIDTSLNVIHTLEHIHGLLKPGGTWINLGPLLWSGGQSAKVELSLEEVLGVARSVGFVVEEGGGKRKRRTINSEYTGDKTSMMRWVYEAEFWVAKKP